MRQGMTIVFVIVSLAIVIGACKADFQDTAKQEQDKDERGHRAILKRVIEHQVYVRDDRTGLCFLGSYSDVFHFTNVPCTDSVLDQIK